MDNTARIPFRVALETLSQARRDTDLVVTNMGAARVWPLISQHPLDLHFNPSTMGGVVPLALGMAVAQPTRQVMALSGDGSLLMSLGSLVTVVASECKNLSVILLDNGRYDVTGGQETAASRVDVRYDEIARSAGFPSVAASANTDSLSATVEQLFQQPGPRFLWLRVTPADPEELKTSTERMPQQLDRIQRELRQGTG